MDARQSSLIAKARGGDAAAFDSLIREHQDAIYRMARHVCAQAPGEADDVFQDTFRYVFAKIPTYELQAKFTTLLFRVARSLCISVLRKKRRVQYTDILDDTLPPPEEQQPGDALDLQVAREALARALQDLPEIYREVLLLRVAQQLPYEEIAAVVDCPLGTVKSRIHLGVQRLRIALGYLRTPSPRPEKS